MNEVIPFSYSPDWNRLTELKSILIPFFSYNSNRGVITVLGVGGFVYSKRSVDKNRYENMKIRERMRKSNEGEYSVENSRRYQS